MDEPAEAVLGKMLLASGMHLAVAESCTGGLISHLITNVPGSSEYYLGGVASYSNEAKMRLLGVRQETLEQHGAVSGETVQEMAQGVRRVFSSEIGLSVSGIAGPSGGTSEKPVGTTWIGLSAQDLEKAYHFQFKGSRLEIKEMAAHEAIRIVLNYLNSLGLSI